MSRCWAPLLGFSESKTHGTHRESPPTLVVIPICKPDCRYDLIQQVDQYIRVLTCLISQRE